MRLAMLAVLGLALLWLSVANSVSLVLGRDAPAMARRTGFPSAEANAREAAAIASIQPAPSPDRIARATRLAQAALRREPGNVTAIVALGTLVSLQRRDDLANRLFSYSERLSRHDPATQLWLIENRVAAGDVSGALLHYGRLMSTTPEFRPALIPILTTATRDPSIARALGGILQTRPLWWKDALVPLIFQSPDPATTLPPLLHQLRLDPRREEDRALMAAAITRLAGAGAFGQAQAFYLDSGGSRLPGQGVRNGGFEGDSRLPPFDWELHNEDGRTATVQARGSGRALFLYVDADHGGDLARQLLLLPPGRYRFSAQSGDVTGDALARPQLRVACAGDKAPVPLDLRLAAAGSAGAGTRADFTVPAGCRAQWLTLSLAPGVGMDSGGQDTPPWIDNIAIVPLTS
jgi:hypothetical protein